MVTFLSFGSEEHGVQPQQGDSFFPFVCSNLLVLFFTIFFSRSFKPNHVSWKKIPFKKGHQIYLTENYMRHFVGSFSLKVRLFKLLSNGRFNNGGLQKNGSLVKGSFHCLRKI